MQSLFTSSVYLQLCWKIHSWEQKINGHPYSSKCVKEKCMQCIFTACTTWSLLKYNAAGTMNHSNTHIQFICSSVCVYWSTCFCSLTTSTLLTLSLSTEKLNSLHSAQANQHISPISPSSYKKLIALHWLSSIHNQEAGKTDETRELSSSIL